MGQSDFWVFAGIGAVALFLIAMPNATGLALTSDQLQQTADFEGFSPSAYADGSNGLQTLYSIGYGHQIQPNESYLLTQTITQEQALQFLINDMQTVVDYLNNSGVALTQGQFDALADFGYNEGLMALGKVLNVLADSGEDAAKQKLLEYIYWHPVAGGPAMISQNLVNRRNAELVTWNN